MVDVVTSQDPLSRLVGPLSGWLEESGCCPERAARVVRAFERFSSWMAVQGLGVEDLDEDLIDAHIRAERQRSGCLSPAALQYLPVAKRFLAEQGLLVLRGPVSRDRGGIPRHLTGPLAREVTQLVAWLHAHGYARGTTQSVACTAARLSAWMDSARLEATDLDEAVLGRFLLAQASGPVPHPSSARRIVTVRRYLLASGLLTTPSEPATPDQQDDPVSDCLQRWGQFLTAERGIGGRWVIEEQRWAAAFLRELTGADGLLDWERVDPAMANRYVTDRGAGYSLSSRRHLVTAMRSLLRWAFLTGRMSRDVTAGVLAPRRPATRLPRALTTRQVEAILTATDRATPIGLRDYAIALMIARLGLRAGEVANLELDDLHWHHGQLTVHGKGARLLRLPLPDDVGNALVTYLREGRPEGVEERAVFLRDRPPLRGLTRAGVSAVVARPAARAGLGTVHAHRLRHTAATAVLRQGGTLIEARELLGHARTDTTMGYAKTDLTALSVLALPWGQVPGS